MARPAFADMLRTEGRHACGQSLYLTVKGPASARWEYRFRDLNKDGKPVVKSMWLGPAIGPAAMSLTQAREARAKEWLARRGGVPRKARSVATGKPFPEAVTEWLAVAAVKWADKTRDGAERALLRLPLASKDVSKITTDDVLSSLLPLPERQRQDVRQNLARALDFAAGRKWVVFDADGNPAKFEGPRRELWPAFKKSDNNLPAVPWQQLPTVYKALPDGEVGDAARFTILTATRPGEVESATWSQIVGENGSSAWIIPADKMKARKEHRIPLTPAALKLLGKPGAPDAPLFKLASNAMLNALQAVAPGMSLHATARAGFKMWSIAKRKDRALTEWSLAHKFGGSVERAYVRPDADTDSPEGIMALRRELMEQWAKFATTAH